jgi:hypothetical protein
MRWLLAACLAAVTVAAAVAGAQVAPSGDAAPQVASSDDTASQAASGGGAESAGTRVLPHAGVVLTVGADFAYQSPAEPFMVAHAIRRMGGKPLQAVSLMAYPVTEKVTAAEFAEVMTAELAQTPAIRDVAIQRLASSIKLGGLDTQGRLLSYTFRGVASSAVRLFAIRQTELAGPDGTAHPIRLCYVLTVEVPSTAKAVLPELLTATARSVRLIDLQRPIAASVQEFEEAFRDYALGYGICPPRGWYARVTPTGVEMGQTDYLLGEPMPLARVVVHEEPTKPDAQACVAEALETFRAGAAEAGQVVEVLSQGPARLAGRDGVEIVLQQAPERTATRPADAPAVLHVVQRTILAYGGKPARQRSYSVRLYCLSEDAARPRQIMETLAGQFELIAPSEVGPATEPAATDAAGQSQ